MPSTLLELTKSECLVRVQMQQLAWTLNYADNCSLISFSQGSVAAWNVFWGKKSPFFTERIASICCRCQLACWTNLNPKVLKSVSWVAEARTHHAKYMHCLSWVLLCESGGGGKCVEAGTSGQLCVTSIRGMFIQQSVSEPVVAWASIKQADSRVGETVTVLFLLECAPNTQMCNR